MVIKLKKLNKLLVERKLVETIEEANELIKSGLVVLNGFTAQNIKTQCAFDSSIKVNHADKKWVSRGAHKLLQGINKFGINPDNMTCIDIGASTGGFTDVLLAHNARRVYAVDVGYGQLAWKLRNNEKVIIMERTNARFLTNDMFEEGKVDLIVSDASFISMKLILPVLEKLLKEDGSIVVLIKPQFEISKEIIENGVVRAPEDHIDVLSDVYSFVMNETGLKLVNSTYSPIKGPEGNIEFLFQCKLKESNSTEYLPDFNTLVSEAHNNVCAHIR